MNELKNRIDAVEEIAENLKATAEQKTGAEYENLPDAVQGLVDGYGGSVENFKDFYFGTASLDDDEWK